MHDKFHDQFLSRSNYERRGVHFSSIIFHLKLINYHRFNRQHQDSKRVLINGTRTGNSWDSSRPQSIKKINYEISYRRCGQNRVPIKPQLRRVFIRAGLFPIFCSFRSRVSNEILARNFSRKTARFHRRTPNRKYLSIVGSDFFLPTRPILDFDFISPTRNKRNEW